MKIEELKTKWCPMVRVGILETSDGKEVMWSNLPSTAEDRVATECIADECACFVRLGADNGRCGLVR